MKDYITLCLIMTVILIIAPFCVFLPSETGQEHTDESSTAATIADQTDITDSGSDKDNNTISVFLTADSKTVTMNMRDYLIGVVAAEMPASYETEALKAQAVVAATYAEYRKLHPDNETEGDISDSSTIHQGYMTIDEMKDKWGDTFDSYYNRIASAVDAVDGITITYDNEPIRAAYHAISNGQTESAKTLWGEDISYLQSVDSTWDKSSTRFSTEVVFSADEIKNLMKDQKGVKFSDNEEDWIEITKISPSGTVLECRICNIKMTGTEVRNLFSLRSASFEVNYNNGQFIFSVQGYGHSVGMSQNGANCMAKEGKSYDEIIKHYYTGVNISD